MMIVPGSIPKMIFDLFCNAPIFTAKIFPAEQKYQNNSQLPARTITLYCAMLQLVQANYSAAGFTAAMGAN
jgi:hypothetical protein